MAGIVIQPYESQAGIRTASGGSGGQYRSARDFMTPGQENLGRGMQQLGAGMEKLGGTLFDAEIQKRQEQLDLKAMEAVQNAFTQNEEWLSNYQDQYQGQEASNAVNDYAANSQKVADELTANFQHNPRALEYVTSRMGSMRQGGIKAMRGYAEEQGKAHLGSLVVQRKSMLSSVYADPNKTPEERAQVAQDYSSLRVHQLVKSGADRQAAQDIVASEIRAFDKDLERNRHAIVRQKSPELASAISRAGIEGRVHVDPVAFVAGKESGTDGSLAIGYDRTGGTSYGKFQISSATMESSFIPWLENEGHTAAAEELHNAGPANTGGRGGAMVDVWKSLVQSGAVTDEMQERFIRGTHLDPALKDAPGGLREAVSASPILEAAALSTAVQHGAKNAKKILSEAWEVSNGDQGMFLASLYEERKTRFSSSTPETQRAMAERLDAERDELFRAGNAVLEPTEWEAELRKDQAEISRRQTEARKQGEALIGDLDNIKTFAIETGDFSTLNRAIDALDALGSNKAAADLREVRAIYGIAQPFLQSIASAPFDERRVKIDTLFSAKSPLFREDNAAVIKEVRDMVTKTVNKQREDFTRDPATYVQKTQNMLIVDEGTAAENKGSVEAAARANMTWQRVIGGPEFAPKPMTAEQANRLKSMLFDTTTSINSKAEQLLSLATAYGDVTPEVLRQVKADESVFAAVRMIMDGGNDTTGAAVKLLSAALTPDNEVPKDADIAQSDISSLIANSEYMQYLAATMRAFPARGDMPSSYRAMQDAAAKMVRIHGKDSIAGLSAPYDFEVDASNGMYLRIPTQSGLDVDDAANALQWIRGDLGERIQGLTDERRQTLRLKGIWRTSGDNAVLSVDGIPYYSMPVATAVAEYKSAVKSAREETFRRNLSLSGEGVQMLADGLEDQNKSSRPIPIERIVQDLSLSGEGLMLIESYKDLARAREKSTGGGK